MWSFVGTEEILQAAGFLIYRKQKEMCVRRQVFRLNN